MRPRKRTYKKVERGIFYYLTADRKRKYGIDYTVNGGVKSLGIRSSWPGKLQRLKKRKSLKADIRSGPRGRPSNLRSLLRGIWQKSNVTSPTGVQRASLNGQRSIFLGRAIDTISTKDMDAYFIKMSSMKIIRGKEPTNATLARHQAVLRGLFSLAVKYDYIDSNPLSGTQTYRIDEKPFRPLTKAEEGRLLAASELPLRRIITVALYCGLRKSELLDLTWENIDFEENVINIVQPKTGKTKIVPMNELVVRTLQEFPDNRQGYIFDWARGDNKKFDRIFHRAVKRARIPKITFHSLRHNFCSRLARLGVDVKTIQSLAGHNDVRTTLKYIHSSPEVKRSAVNALLTGKLHGDSTAIDPSLSDNSVESK